MPCVGSDRSMIYCSAALTYVKESGQHSAVHQLSQQRDFIVLAVRTPVKDEESDGPQRKTGQSKLDGLDEEWATEHAHQVSRMLPGGLFVLGVFLITSPELSKEAQNVLRKLVFSVDRTVMKTRLWHYAEDDVTDRVALHFCSVAKKITCRTYDVRDAKCSAKPADWKYQSGVSSSWVPLECTIKVDIHVPLPATSVKQDFQRSLRDGLAKWALQIEKSVFLLNGQVKEEDSELLYGQKKSRGTFPLPSFVVQVLTQIPQSSGERSTAAVQVCTGSTHLQGVLKCRAYIHSNKPKVKDAVQALKRDILNTVSDRCEALFEDLLLDGTLDQKESVKTSHSLPRRVFAPIVGSGVKLCGYMFDDEAAGEIRERFLELLDQDLKEEDFDIAEEINTEKATSDTGDAPRLVTPNIEHQESNKTSTVAFSVQQNLGVVLAAACALLAIAISLHYYIN
ncbi:protein odr-4 homolog isoform X2 [Pleurodeles waltl]|uniref:protein odr-4 homolog isoform X2 n=1 Tax=Pleurodeles waltl TaxID=8319 RepID=UPI0037093EE5